MELEIAGERAFVYCGGKSFDRNLPAVVLIHGAGNDHSVWNFQARHLAHRGFAVLAPDLPGHGRSGSEAIDRIEALADWLVGLLDVAGVVRAALVGHSMGSLVALECAARHPERVHALALVGSVAPMPVAEVLLDAARTDRARAHAMINQWSFLPTTPLRASAAPGSWLVGTNQRLMERQREGVLHAALSACNGYLGGLDAAARVRCPTLMLCGARDQMTPAPAARPLREALANTPGGARMILIQGAGHAMMAEAPDAVSDSIREFLTSTQQP